MAEYRKEKYYWFKLKDDFFKRHDIKIIKSMPNGKDYVIFYLQLLCESLSHNGKLRFNEEIPYSEEMLSVITDTNIDIVRSAMKLFVQLKIIDIMDDQTIYMTKLQNMVGSTTVGAEKKKLQRNKSIELLEGGQKVDICPPEINKEKEIDIEIDIEKEIIINNNYKSNDINLTSEETDSIFKRMMKSIEEQVSPITFETFFRSLKHKGILGNRLVLVAQPFMRDIILEKYADKVEIALLKASERKLIDVVWEE
jgi:predicted phage replisome organizer